MSKSPENKRSLNKSCRDYKKELRKSFSKYQKKFEKDLREMSTKDGKKFWNLLKSFSGSKSDNETKLSLERLYEYFKELNSSDEEPVDDDFSRFFSHNELDILNSKITEDEIIFAIKNLKNSKAPGIDNIVNEYLKTHIEQISSILRKVVQCCF